MSLWEEPNTRASGACRRRVFTGTLDARLLALDADTGLPCADFGEGGQIDLTHGVRIRDPGDYLVTSPPAVYRDLVIVGSAIGDNRATNVERGIIRAFEAHTGALVWSFDPLPDSPSHPAAAEWNLAQAASTGAANAWGVMSVDEEHGLVLVPTGSASPDFYGGERLGPDRFADTLLALDAAQRPARLAPAAGPPRPVGLRPGRAAGARRHRRAGQCRCPAVIQATKTGMLYVFERTHGRALFPITERHVPGSSVPGEKAWPTQPFSSLPALVSQAPVRRAGCMGSDVLGPRQVP